MRPYDAAQPLIFVHIPKTAGVSVKTVIKSWFPDRFHNHYYNEQTGQPPVPLDLEAAPFRAAPPVIYGHFNSLRNFGIPQQYPQVRQCVTILRDPFDMHLSRYFYTRKVAGDWKRTSDVGEAALSDFLENGHLNMLEHFPRPMTRANFRDVLDEFFVDMGCFETLKPSLRRMAARLGKPADIVETLPHLNATARDQDVDPEARARFRERWPLEFDVYDHVRALQTVPEGDT